MDSLTPKQQQFVKEYLVDLNGTQAAIRAGYSPKTAQPQSSRLLLNVMVQRAINEGMRKRAKRVEVNADSVVAELAKLGFANMLDYMRTTDQGDAYVDLSDLDRDRAAAISEITVEDFTDGRGDQSRDVRKVKLKLHDKRAALVDLGKHLGLFGTGRGGEGDTHNHLHLHGEQGREALEAAKAKLRAEVQALDYIEDAT